MRLNKGIVITILCCCFSFILNSQSATKNIPLKDVLSVIEQRYEVTFSYRSSDVLQVTVEDSILPSTLIETLSILESQTDLTFTNLGNGYITITKTPLQIAEINTLKSVYLFDVLAKGISQSKDGSFIINYKAFDILPGLIEPDVLKTAQALPGIESVDETVTNLSIRAGTHDQNLILWDGIKLYQSGHFFGLISAFNANLTEKTTIYKNGTPSQYTDGVSGTFAIQTSEQVNDSLHAGLGVNLVNADAFVDIPIGKSSSAQIALRSSINDVFETPTYTSYFDKAFEDTEITNSPENIDITNDNFTFQDASLRWLWNLSDKDLIKANALFVTNNLSFRENSIVAGIPESRESGSNQENLGGGLDYRRQWSERFMSNIHLSGTSYTLKATNADILNNQRLIQTNEVLETNLKLHTSYTINPQFSIENGYQFIETGITNSQDVDNPLFQRTIKDVLRSHAVYSQITYNSKNFKSLVKLGARATYLAKFKKFIAEPRLTLSHKLSKRLTFNLQAELKHQTATQVIEFQNDFLGVENRRWILSDNDSIPIVQSKQVSTGLSYKNKGWLLSGDFFLKNVDGITSQSQGFQNQFRRSNVNGSYDAFGFETLVYRKWKKLNLWLTYCYTNSDYTFENLTPQKFPNNFELRHSLTIGSSYKLKDWHFSAGLNYRSGKPITRATSVSPNDGSIQFSEPNASYLEDYFRFDVSSSYTFKISNRLKGHAGVSLWNILSTNNTINQYYQVSDSGQLLDIRQKSLGFTPNVSFRVSF